MEVKIMRFFTKKLYDLKIIFSFNWMSWDTGRKNIEDINFNYTRCSLLEITMYITTIFREDRFSDGHIKSKLENGTLDKIFGSLKNLLKHT